MVGFSESWAVANSRLLGSGEKRSPINANQRNWRVAIQSLAVWLFSGREAATAQWASRPPRPLRPGGAPPLAYAARQKGVPPRAYLWQGAWVLHITNQNLSLAGHPETKNRGIRWRLESKCWV